VLINGEAELVDGEYVSGDFFSGLGVSPAGPAPRITNNQLQITKAQLWFRYC
jgi:hypothetical protein